MRTGQREPNASNQEEEEEEEEEEDFCPILYWSRKTAGGICVLTRVVFIIFMPCCS
jgi:hypothetical protein